MPGKKEVLHNFKSCEQFADWLNRAVADLDRQKSEVVRCCIMLALPTIMNNPALLDLVRFEDIRRGADCQ
ncbi:MAG: hypothetical protein WHT06_14640 [Desulfobacterales bacterium]